MRGLVKSGLIVIAAVLILAVGAMADVPSMFNYQGYLEDSGGNPITGTVQIAFSICADSVGSACNWTEVHPTVSVTDGLFNVKLGSITPIVDIKLADPERWLGINVDGESLPYTQLVSVPYAHRISTVDGATGGEIFGKLDAGTFNSNPGSNAFVFGNSNDVAGQDAVVSGGNGNEITATGQNGVISGGGTNDVDSAYGTVGGGRSNRASGEGATVAGGEFNAVLNSFSTIAGGESNTINGTHTFVGGGQDHFAPGGFGVIAGGQNNSIYESHSFIGGGQNNTSEEIYSVVAGGYNNENFGQYSAIGGGQNQVASGNHSVIAGGFQSDAGADYATIGGGRVNKAYGHASTIAGGWVNKTDGQYSGILGGAENLVGGDYSAILGGFGDTITATGHYSYLFGIQSVLSADSTFMVDMPHIRFGDETSGYEFPTADGSAGQVMATDGSGQLSWTTGGGGGGGGGWVDDGAVVRLDTDADEVGVGTVTPDAKFHVEAAQTHAGRFTSSVGTNDSAVFTAEYIGGGDVDAIAVHGKSFPNDFWGIGGKFESNYLGVHAEVYPAGTNTYLAMNAIADGGTGNNFGLKARAQNCTQATGVDAAVQNGTDFAIGVNGRVDNNTGYSYGVMGGVSSTATGNFNYGVSGGSMATGFWNYGVSGLASGASVGNMGVDAYGSGSSGWKRAINAEADGAGINHAIYCWAEDAAATENYGIYASANSASGVNWAGYFNGNVNITGTLTGGKSGMRIDHPDDPENQYLQHSNIVSPDMMTVYNGNVVTDSEGRATVTMPDYFESLNGDFRYQLTAIGSFSQAIVLDEITNNRFVIATDQPNIKVSWQVTGIRKDPVAQTQRIETELVKAANEKGLYQNPTAFGLSRDMGINQVEAPAKNEQLDEMAAGLSSNEIVKK